MPLLIPLHRTKDGRIVFVKGLMNRKTYLVRDNEECRKIKRAYLACIIIIAHICAVVGLGLIYLERNVFHFTDEHNTNVFTNLFFGVVIPLAFFTPLLVSRYVVHRFKLPVLDMPIELDGYM